MSLSSSFTNFSLPELFKVIEQGKKTGCLTVCTVPELHNPSSKSQYYYIWFRQGRIIAASNRLNGQGLTSKIVEKGLASEEIIDIFCSRASKATIPLGLNLKTQGVLSSEDLKILFAAQVQQIRDLFEIHNGVFKFDSQAREPIREMTGLSLGATEVALMVLRALRNWEVLSHVLPDASSGIENIAQTKPQFQRNSFDSQVWEFANGKFSLTRIAKQLHQPTGKIQQAAFRLMIADLVKEIPIVASTYELNTHEYESTVADTFRAQDKSSKQVKSHKVSSSFMQNLVGFLRSKA